MGGIEAGLGIEGELKLASRCSTKTCPHRIRIGETKVGYQNVLSLILLQPDICCWFLRLGFTVCLAGYIVAFVLYVLIVHIKSFVNLLAKLVIIINPVTISAEH